MAIYKGKDLRIPSHPSRNPWEGISKDLGARDVRWVKRGDDKVLQQAHVSQDPRVVSLGGSAAMAALKWAAPDDGQRNTFMPPAKKTVRHKSFRGLMRVSREIN